MARYFHATSPKKAKLILAQGFDHRNPVMGRDDTDPDRFGDDPAGWENWYNYYHLFFKALDPATVRDLKVVLHDDSLTEAERGRFMHAAWKEIFGDQWTMMWVGRNEVYIDYGPAVLEFTPTTLDLVMEDLDYWVVLHLSRRIPASQFKLLGRLPPDADSLLETSGDGAAPILAVEKLLAAD